MSTIVADRSDTLYARTRGIVLRGGQSDRARLATGLALSLVLHSLVFIFGLHLHVPQLSQPAPVQGALSVRLVPASEFQSPASDNRVPAKNAVHAVSPRQRLLPVSVYFPSSQLDVQAEVLNDVMLHYPLEAYRQGLRGQVTLKLLISRDGQIDKVTVIDARPKNIFDEAAIAAALQLRYSPAIKDGVAVGAMKKVTITFDPTDQAL